MNNKWISYLLIVVVILAGGYYYFNVYKKDKDSPPITKQEEISKVDIIAKNLADKHQATIDWEGDSKFTLQLQERLITGRPTLFRGYIEDVFSRDDKKFIRFSASYSYENSYVLELECNQEIVDRFLEQASNASYPDEGYALVANIQEVSRPTPIKLSGSIYFAEDDGSLDIHETESFIARGTCVDIAHLENN